MKPSKRLSLRRVAMTDLTTDDLRHLAGANNTPLCVTAWITVCRECPSDPVTGCTVIHPTEQATCIC